MVLHMYFNRQAHWRNAYLPTNWIYCSWNYTSCSKTKNFNPFSHTLLLQEHIFYWYLLWSQNTFTIVH